MVTSTILWAFILSLGTAFGAGVYEHRIVLPQWLLASPGGLEWKGEAARAADTGRRFWVWVTTVPLTLLTLASLYAAWQIGGAAGRWWSIAAWLALVERLLTFGYFIPAMVKLFGRLPASDAVQRARRWMSLNLLRHALVYAAWLAALRALSLLP